MTHQSPPGLFEKMYASVARKMHKAGKALQDLRVMQGHQPHVDVSQLVASGTIPLTQFDSVGSSSTGETGEESVAQVVVPEKPEKPEKDDEAKKDRRKQKLIAEWDEKAEKLRNDKELATSHAGFDEERIKKIADAYQAQVEKGEKELKKAIANIDSGDYQRRKREDAKSAAQARAATAELEEYWARVRKIVSRIGESGWLVIDAKLESTTSGSTARDMSISWQSSVDGQISAKLSLDWLRETLGGSDLAGLNWDDETTVACLYAGLDDVISKDGAGTGVRKPARSTLFFSDDTSGPEVPGAERLQERLAKQSRGEAKANPAQARLTAERMKREKGLK